MELSNQGARLEDAQAELAACQLAGSACAQEKASLQEAYLEASAKQFPPGAAASQQRRLSRLHLMRLPRFCMTVASMVCLMHQAGPCRGWYKGVLFLARLPLPPTTPTPAR